MTEKTQRKKFDVLIIGGGVVGTAVARSLAKLKLKTALVEKEVELAFGTTKANSGIVHAGFQRAREPESHPLCKRMRHVPPGLRGTGCTL